MRASRRLIIIPLGILFMAACAPPNASAAQSRASAVMPFSLDLVRETVRGRVQTHVDAGPYSYLEIAETAGTRRWVVLIGQSAAPGQDVVVTVYGSQLNFVSKRLKRKFASLGFGRLNVGGTTSPTPTQP